MGAATIYLAEAELQTAQAGGITVTQGGGHWSQANDTRYSGGHAITSATTGDTLTISFTGRALYASVTTTGIRTRCTVTIDGVLQAGYLDTSNGSAAGVYYGVLVPIARGLADGAHTVVITCDQVSNNVYFDAFFVLTGAKGTALPGVAYGVGDSIMAGTGAQNSQTYIPARVQALLAAALRRPISMTAVAVTGEMLTLQSGTAYPSGGIHRIINSVLPNQPEFLFVMYGSNDLSNQGANPVPPGDFARHWQGLLCFLEDALDTSQVRVAVGTPPIIGPNYLTGAASLDKLEAAIWSLRQTVAAFPWARLADIYGAMDGRMSLVYPNSGADFGFHPNEAGHEVIGNEFLRALLGVQG